MAFKTFLLTFGSFLSYLFSFPFVLVLSEWRIWPEGVKWLNWNRRFCWGRLVSLPGFKLFLHIDSQLVGILKGLERLKFKLVQNRRI